MAPQVTYYDRLPVYPYMKYPPPSGLPTLPPVVKPDTFTYNLPPAGPYIIGTCHASNNPTTWAIVSGNDLGYFFINNYGVLSINDIASLAGTYDLIVAANNAAGSGQADITVILNPPPPVVISDTFNLTLPVTVGDIVGQCSATNNPTSWALVVGGFGYFLVDINGQVIVTAQGQLYIMAGHTYNLNITASNAGGTSPSQLIFVVT
jgi:hypothetical protein